MQRPKSPSVKREETTNRAPASATKLRKPAADSSAVPHDGQPKVKCAQDKHSKISLFRFMFSQISLKCTGFVQMPFQSEKTEKSRTLFSTKNNHVFTITKQDKRTKLKCLM